MFAGGFFPHRCWEELSDVHHSVWQLSGERHFHRRWVFSGIRKLFQCKHYDFMSVQCSIKHVDPSVSVPCVPQVRASWLLWSLCLFLGGRSPRWWEKCTTSLQSTLSDSAPVTLTLCRRRESSLGTTCKHHTLIHRYYTTWNTKVWFSAADPVQHKFPFMDH